MRLAPPRLAEFFTAWLALTSIAAAAERRVVLTADTPATEISRYYSLLAHGPTKKFFVLPESNVVVVVATVDGKADASATIHVFPADVSAERVAKWINNQHSDALHPDAPQPLRSLVVPPDRFHAKAGPVLDHEKGEGGDEYDRVRVEFTIDAFEDGDIAVAASKGTLDAFIRTKEPVVREPRLTRSLPTRRRVS